MITTPKQRSTYASPSRLAANPIVAAVRWPFVNKFASPLWLALRLYIGWIWFQMALSKINAGWLTSDPVGQMFKAIAGGKLPVPMPFYRDVAQGMLDLGIAPMLSHSMPFLEMAVALSFVSGVLVPVAAVGAILLNINIILSGMGSPAFDGPIIASEVLFLMSYRVVGAIGFERIAIRILNAVVGVVLPRRKVEASAR
jgi:thiosulfate dehydrogenase (quinone) large subunit